VIYGILSCHQSSVEKKRDYTHSKTKRGPEDVIRLRPQLMSFPRTLSGLLTKTCETKTRANVLTNVVNHDSGSWAGAVGFSCICICL
jgi:hypothetical protein